MIVIGHGGLSLESTFGFIKKTQTKPIGFYAYA